MRKLEVIVFETHKDKRWRLRERYMKCVASDAFCLIAAREMPAAAVCVPLAFVATNDGFSPVAVQALQTGENLLVDQEGRWLSRYMPATYRAYPFVLGNTEDAEHVLCIDTELAQVSDAEGVPFFNPAGELMPLVAQALDLLSAAIQDRAATSRICAALDAHQLIRPWEIKVQSNRGDREVKGLYQIDEVALNALSQGAFQELREAGGLPVAYCQLLSMQHLQQLASLEGSRSVAAVQGPSSSAAELNLDFLNGSDTLTLSGSSS